MQFKEIKFMKEVAHPDVRVCVIVPVIHLPKGWQLCFGQTEKSIAITMDSQRSEGSRVFKTLEAAVKEAKKLGFDRVSVYNP